MMIISWQYMVVDMSLIGDTSLVYPSILERRYAPSGYSLVTTHVPPSHTYYTHTNNTIKNNKNITSSTSAGKEVSRAK